MLPRRRPIVVSLFLLGALLLLDAALLSAEVRTIAATGEYRMGDNDTRTDAKRLALLDAKRLALEQAGTYLESITEVKNLQVTHDELRAYTAGIIEVTEQATKDVIEGATHIVWVVVTAKIDIDIVAGQIDVLKKNEEAKAEMMRLQKEVERWRQEAQLKTRELAALKTKSEVEAAVYARQQMLDKVQANYLLSYAWAAFKSRRSIPSEGVSANVEGRKLARTFTEQALALDPDNSAGHVILGMILLEEKNYEAAVSELRRALNLAHNFATIDIAAIHTMIGRALQSNGDSSGALAELKAAIHLAPDSAVAHFRLGLVLKERRDLERAISEFHSTLHLSPGNADAHLMLGLALQEKGRHDEAIAEFLATLRLNPEEDLAVAAPLLSFLEADQPDIVIAKIRGQLRPLSDDAGGFVALGVILSAPPRSDRDSAIAAYREALRLRPNYALAHYHLGHTLFSNGDRDGGIAEMRTALKLQPDQAGWHTILGNMLRERYYEDPDAAIPEFQEALRLEPANVLARVGLARALHDKGYNLWKKGEARAAISEFQEALRLSPDDAGAHVYLGSLLSDLGGRDAAAEFEQALRLNPAHAANAHRNVGDLYRDKNNLGRALAEYREALRIEKDEVPKMPIDKLKASFLLPYEEIKSSFLFDVYWKLGRVLEDQGDLDGAMIEYRKAVAIDAKRFGPHMGMGDILFKRNELDAAIAEYREAVRLYPSVTTHHALGGALRKKGDLASAIDEYKTALRLEPDCLAGHCHNDLGIALYEGGEIDGAIAAFREALRLRSNEGVIHHSLGRALSKKGEFNGAVAEYRTALRLKPDYAAVHYSLGEAPEALGQRAEAAREFHSYLLLVPDTPDNRTMISNARVWLHKLEQ